MSAGEVVILCAGGHARVLIDVLRRAGRLIAGITDADGSLHGQKLDGVPILGDDDVVLAWGARSAGVVNGLGNVPTSKDSGLSRRRALFDRFKNAGFQFLTVVSPDAYISKTAELEEGAQVITGAIIHPGCRVGRDVIVNTGAQLDHDCHVGDHSHIAPGAVLCGDVTVGACAHIGAGSVIVPGVKIGDSAVVGAGAVVLTNVPAGTMVLGNPAQGKKP